MSSRMIVGVVWASKLPPNEFVGRGAPGVGGLGWLCDASPWWGLATMGVAGEGVGYVLWREQDGKVSDRVGGGGFGAADGGASGGYR